MRNSLRLPAPHGPATAHTVPGRDSVRGGSLLTAIVMLAVLSTLMAAFLGSAADHSRVSSTRTGRFEVKRSASSINRLAAQYAWGGYTATLAGGETNLLGLRAHLDNIALTDQSGLVPTQVDVTNDLGLPVNANGDLALGDTTVQSVNMFREDDGRVVNLFVTSVTTTVEGGRPLTHTMTDVFSIEAPSWDGLDFALLANNINCIMCHAEIDDVERVYAMGGAAGPAGTGRTRVGSIESIQFREDPSSTIAGTLYLGGNAIDEDGDPIGDWAGLDLKAAELDSEGRVIADAFGALNHQDLSPADPLAPAPFENLYLNYLDQPVQVDGEMPGSFPLPFRDDGGLDPLSGDLDPTGAGNRQVDDNEFFSATDSFTGSILGGKIGVSAPGATVDTAAAASALVAGTETTLGAITSGNVILTGTDADPIRLDGLVAIDGDLIISGPVEGSGSLWVRGNIYVRGDLEYNDAYVGTDRQFGINSSGQSNTLGMTAGGNVVIGDIYRPQWGEGSDVDGTDSGTWNFTLEQAAAFNGREWVKTQETLPGKKVEVFETNLVPQEQFIETVTMVSTPRYKWVPNGTFWEKDIYDNVQVGTQEVPVYTTIHHPNTLTPPYDNSWSETVQTGTTTEPVYESQVVGTEMVEHKDKVIDYYEDVPTTTYESYDPPQFVDVAVTTSTWEVPMLPNPDYKGPNYAARYYQFGEGDPIPIQNKKGYFDDVKQLWVMSEGVTSWDTSELTLADPNDPADPSLFPSGRPAAALTTLEPTASWMDPDILRGLITDSLGSRDVNEPFKVDATVYSANSIFGVVPKSTSEGTDGSMRVQGALLAADIGLLAPTGLELYYDSRGQEVLDIRDEADLGLRFVGTLPAPAPVPVP